MLKQENSVDDDDDDNKKKTHSSNDKRERDNLSLRKHAGQFASFSLPSNVKRRSCAGETKPVEAFGSFDFIYYVSDFAVCSLFQTWISSTRT